ncbi:MAG: CBS domain-containing protein [Candidatus Bathyarchaeota archaeon]|nr:MAG: CBS domain-containing protein [Candidatus Bathyarchaeota archaeon]
MKIERLMVRNVVTLKMDATAHEAVKIMNRDRIGCLVIFHNGDIVGILTERDLLERVLEECKNPKETLVSEIMTRHVIVGSPNMELVEATRLMFKHNVKKLPITQGSRLVGLVTVTDIARATSVDHETMELIETLSHMHRIDAAATP